MIGIPFQLNDLISRNRAFIMGTAMICIMLFHQEWLYGGLYDIMHRCGHWGVDVFLVISGWGIGHSLEKNDVRTFYGNRIKRIIPACIIMGGLSLLCVFSGLIVMPRKMFLYMMPLSLHQWYIDAILIYYALSPILLKGIKKYGFLLLLSILISCFPLQSVNLSTLWPLNWVNERFPAFCLGLWLCTKRDIIISYWYSVLMLGGGFLLYCLVVNNIKIWDSSNYQYLLLLPVMPMIIFVTSNIAQLMNYIGLRKIVEWIGKHSLEIYLSHALIYSVVAGRIVVNSYMSFFISSAISLLMAYLLKLVTARMERLFVVNGKERT